MFKVLEKKHKKTLEDLIKAKKEVSIWERWHRELYNALISEQDNVCYVCRSFASDLEILGYKLNAKKNSINSIQSLPSNNQFNLEFELNKIIGLNDVKKYLMGVQAQLRIQLERSKMGLATVKPVNHMIFQGNPGTGKTTIARILVNILYEMGVLKKKKFVETDRSGLVAEYVGQTALKTQGKINEALDGILFIDEAYSLASDVEGIGFGKEAIDALVKGMEDNRERLIVILAGYTEEMRNFIKVNPGLQSRFSNIIDFPDYSVEELLAISIKLFKENDYSVTSGAVEKMRVNFSKASGEEHFGNGRYVRNFFEETIRNQAVRLHTIESSRITKNIITEITIDDIPC